MRIRCLRARLEGRLVEEVEDRHKQTEKRHGPIENVPHDLVQIDVIQKSIKQRVTVR